MAVRRRRPSRPGGGSMLSVSFQGADSLEDLSNRIREAGRDDLQRELRNTLRRQARELEREVRGSMSTYIPSGYRPTLARALRFTSRVRTHGAGTGVSVTMRATGGRDIRALDRRGRLRHPLFGRMEYLWFNTQLPAGFHSEPVARVLERVRRDTIALIDRLLRQIGRT